MAVALWEVIPGSSSAGVGKWGEEGAGEGCVTTSPLGGLELVPRELCEQHRTHASPRRRGGPESCHAYVTTPTATGLGGGLLLGSVQLRWSHLRHLHFISHVQGEDEASFGRLW